VQFGDDPADRVEHADQLVDLLSANVMATLPRLSENIGARSGFAGTMRAFPCPSIAPIFDSRFCGRKPGR
jgi:hypothetical protein